MPLKQSDRFPVYPTGAVALAFALLVSSASAGETGYQPTYCSSPVVIDSPAVVTAGFDNIVERTREELDDRSGISIVLFDKKRILYSYQAGPAGSGTPVNRDTAFYIASSTKSLVATTTLKLSEEGVLDLDAPISQYLPELHFDSWLLAENRITLRRLLTHDTGISSKALEIRTSITGEHDRPTLMRLYSQASGSFLTPQYSNLNYILAGLVLEEVTGRSWQKLLQDELFQPLGMQRSFTRWAGQNIALPHTLDQNKKLLTVPTSQSTLRDNTLFPSGGVIASATDLARYVQLFLNCGELNGESYLSPATVEMAVSSLAENSGGGIHEYFGFGLGWEIARHDGLTIALHNGSNKVGARAYMGFAPNLQVGLVILSNENIVTPYVQGAIARYVWDTLRDPQLAKTNLARNLEDWRGKAEARFGGRMDGRQYPVFDYPEQLFPNVPLSTFVGTYRSEKFGTVNVAVKQGQLRFQYGNMVSQRIKRLTADQFVGDFGIEAEQIKFDLSDGIAREITFVAMGTSFRRTGS